jgi:hypothetical protein
MDRDPDAHTAGHVFSQKLILWEMTPQSVILAKVFILEHNARDLLLNLEK